MVLGTEYPYYVFIVPVFFYRLDRQELSKKVDDKLHTEEGGDPKISKPGCKYEKVTADFRLSTKTHNFGSCEKVELPRPKKEKKQLEVW